MYYQLLEKSGLHPTEFQLVEFVATHQTEGGWCDVPKKIMAEELKVSPSRIFYLLHSLVVKEFLIKSKRKNNKRRSCFSTTNKWKELFYHEN